MPAVDRDCKDLLKDVPEWIIKDMQDATNKRARLKELKAENERAKELLQMRLEAHTKLQNIINTHPKGPRAGLVAILTNDTWAKAQNLNVQYYQKGIQGYAEKFIPTLKQELSTGFLGIHVPKAQKKLRQDFVRAVMDKATDNPLAVKMAKEANEMLEFLRTEFNRYGGNIGKLRTGQGYLPQSHNPEAIGKEGREVWKKFIYERLDDANRADVDLGALNLDNVYDTIITGGLSKVGIESGFKAGKSTAKKHADERVLDFKDGKAWLEYQERFGSKDPLAALDDHIRKLTTDIALIKILGPNPDAMFRTLSDEVIAAKTLKGDKNPSEGMDMLQNIYNVVSGKVDMDKMAFKHAGKLQSIRAMNTAALLGNASLSTVTDPLLAAFTATYQGMNPAVTLGGYVKNIIRSASKRTFEEEQLMGLGADVFSSEVTKRFSELGGGFFAKASEAVMRGTFMNILTESARMSFKAQYFKKLLGNRKLEELTPDEHIELLAKVNEESDYAVIMGDARARAISTAGKEKGTMVGEISRSTTQFMTFPVSFMVKQGSRIFRQQKSVGHGLAYATAIFTILTVGGGIAMMLKDASKGYTTRRGSPFDENADTKDYLDFWRAAAAQGGGLGLLGDWFFSDVNRFGNSHGVTLGGPSFGLAIDAGKLAVGNLQELAEGETTNFGSESIEFVNRHINPVKTFYTQAVMERFVVRNLKIMLDDEYEKKERKRERKRRKDYGQEKFDFLTD